MRRVPVRCQACCAPHRGMLKGACYVAVPESRQLAKHSLSHAQSGRQPHYERVPGGPWPASAGAAHPPSQRSCTGRGAGTLDLSPACRPTGMLTTQAVWAMHAGSLRYSEPRLPHWLAFQEQAAFLPGSLFGTSPSGLPDGPAEHVVGGQGGQGLVAQHQGLCTAAGRAGRGDSCRHSGSPTKRNGAGAPRHARRHRSSASRRRQPQARPPSQTRRMAGAPAAPRRQPLPPHL